MTSIIIVGRLWGMGRLSKQETEARRGRLGEVLARRGYLPLARVCELMGVSEATARRDLASLEGRKLVKRTHGGALGPYSGALGDFERFFPTFDQRRGEAEGAKRAIAEVVVGMIREMGSGKVRSGGKASGEGGGLGGGTVFIDAGTTCFAVAEAMERMGGGEDGVGAAAVGGGGGAVGMGGGGGEAGVRVVTHSLAVAVKLGQVGWVREVEVLGGRLLPRQAALFGDEGCRGVSGRRIDLAIICGEGMDGEGVWNSQEDVVRLQRAAMAAAGRVVVVMDRTKLGKGGPVLMTGWGGVDVLVTDAKAGGLVRAGIELGKGRVVVVDAGGEKAKWRARR